MSATELPVQMFDRPPTKYGRGAEWKQVLVRMPAQMVEHLDRCADVMYRSRTAEILMRLEQSMEGESIDEVHGVILTHRPLAAK